MTSPLFRFSLLSLALAAGFAHAENEAKESVTLDTVTVKGDRQGSKIKTNIVTLQQKDENTATDLRGLLKDEPAIDFGGGNGSSQFLTLRGMGQNSVDIKVDNAYSDSQMLYHQGRFIIDPALSKSSPYRKARVPHLPVSALPTVRLLPKQSMPKTCSKVWTKTGVYASTAAMPLMTA